MLTYKLAYLNAPTKSQRLKQSLLLYHTGFLKFVVNMGFSKIQQVKILWNPVEEILF